MRVRANKLQFAQRTPPQVLPPIDSHRPNPINTQPMPKTSPPPPPTKLAPVYAIVGHDSFLQTRKVADIAATLGDAAQRADLDGPSASPADVLDELRSFAMFGSAKLVIVRDADDFVSRAREPLEDYVASPAPDSVLVLRLSSLPSNTRLYKAIAKHGRIETCDPPKPHQLPAWIADHARREYSLVITPAASAMLADLIGADLGRLDQELAKLAVAHGTPAGAPPTTRATIDVAQISDTVAFQREMEMWNLTDALSAGDKTQALRRWRHLVRMDSSAEFRAITWLSLWLENLRKALVMRRQRVPDQVIARNCRIFDPRLATTFLATAARLGETGIDHALVLLAELDRRNKSGLGDAAENVERFILTVAP